MPIAKPGRVLVGGALLAALAGCGSGAGVASVAGAATPTSPAAPTSPTPTPAVTAGTGVAVSAGAVTPTEVTASPGPPAPTTPPPTLSGARTVTEADNGATVRLRVGEQLRVALDGSGGQWDPPRSSGSALRETAASGGYPTGQPARATYLAVASGSASVTASTDYACLHTQPACEIAQRIWIVHVIVA